MTASGCNKWALQGENSCAPFNTASEFAKLFVNCLLLKVVKNGQELGSCCRTNVSVFPLEGFDVFKLQHHSYIITTCHIDASKWTITFSVIYTFRRADLHGSTAGERVWLLALGLLTKSTSSGSVSCVCLFLPQSVCTPLARFEFEPLELFRADCRVEITPVRAA